MVRHLVSQAPGTTGVQGSFEAHGPLSVVAKGYRCGAQQRGPVWHCCIACMQAGAGSGPALKIFLLASAHSSIRMFLLLNVWHMVVTVLLSRDTRLLMCGPHASALHRGCSYTPDMQSFIHRLLQCGLCCNVFQHAFHHFRPVSLPCGCHRTAPACLCFMRGIQGSLGGWALAETSYMSVTSCVRSRHGGLNGTWPCSDIVKMYLMPLRGHIQICSAITLLTS